MSLSDRRPGGKIFSGVSRTRQDQADATDINKIVAKYERTGQIAMLNPNKPVYGDFTNASDYLSAVNSVREAERRFLALPAALRAECENDPGQLIDYVEDDKNIDALVAYGVIDPPEGWVKPKEELPPGPTKVVLNEPEPAPQSPEEAGEVTN